MATIKNGEVGLLYDFSSISSLAFCRYKFYVAKLITLLRQKVFSPHI
jgi:hypothetical protein